MSRLDIRLAAPATGARSTARPAAVAARCGSACPTLEMSAATLAVLGDYVPFGLSQALGRLGSGNSLDNTLRIASLVPTEWVLLDIRVHAVANGFGNGAVLLWTEDGTSWPRPASRPSCAPSTSSPWGRCRHGGRRPDVTTCGGRTGDHIPPFTAPGGSRAALRDDDPVRQGATARPTRVDRGARSRSATPTSGRARPTAPTGSRRWRWRRCGRRRCGSASPSCPPTRAGPAHAGAVRRVTRRRRAGSVRLRHRHVVERHRRELERHPVRGAVQEGHARPSGSCAWRSPARSSARTTGRSRSTASSCGVVPEQQPRILIAALRAGMLRLAGREGDGAIVNWLSADDVTQVVPHVHAGGADKEVVARIFVAPTDRHRRGARHGPLRHRRLPERPRLRRVPPLGRAWRAAAPMWDLWAAGDRKAALAAIPDEIVDELIVHGSPEALPRAHPALHRQRRHLPGPGPAALRLRPAPGDPRPRPVTSAPTSSVRLRHPGVTRGAAPAGACAAGGKLSCRGARSRGTRSARGGAAARSPRGLRRRRGRRAPPRRCRPWACRPRS